MYELSTVQSSGIEFNLPSEPLKAILDWGLLYTEGYIVKRFKRYRLTNEYPDGKGMDCQPRALLMMFDQLEYLLDWHKQKLMSELEPQG